MADVGSDLHNFTGNASDLYLFGITSTLQQAFLWLQLPIGVIILTLNSITLIVLYKTYMHQEALRVLFASMSMSDATVGMIYAVNCFLRLNPTLLTAVTCGFRFIALYCVVFVSMGNVALLALDRCIVLSFPLRYVSIATTRPTVIASVMLWTVSAILAILSFRRALQNFSVCILLKTARYSEVLIIPPSVFGLVVVIVIVCYVIILYHVRRQMRKIFKETARKPQPLGAATVSVTAGQAKGEDAPHLADDVTPKPKLRLRYLKTVTSILGLFLICYIPIISLFGYLLANPLAMQSRGAIMILNGSFFLLVINSIVNPILYTWKTRKLQLKFLKLFCVWSERCQKKIRSIQQSDV